MVVSADIRENPVGRLPAGLRLQLSDSDGIATSRVQRHQALYRRTQIDDGQAIDSVREPYSDCLSKYRDDQIVCPLCYPDSASASFDVVDFRCG